MYRFSYPAEKFDERNLDKNVILTLVRKHEGMVDRLIRTDREIKMRRTTK